MSNNVIIARKTSFKREHSTIINIVKILIFSLFSYLLQKEYLQYIKDNAISNFLFELIIQKKHGHLDRSLNNFLLSVTRYDAKQLNNQVVLGTAPS